MIQRLGFVSVLVVVLGLSANVNGAHGASPNPQRGGVYLRPLAADATTLDPARVIDIYSRAVVTQLFDGLVQYDKALAIRPGLAETWRASRDGLQWTFRLRPDVTFHTGRAVTAEDVVYSITRSLGPGARWTGATYLRLIRGAEAFVAGRVATVTGVRALDRRTVEITLTEPVGPSFLLALAGASIVPRAVVERDVARFARQPVGTGPFRFVEWIPNTRIVLAANPDYFEGRPSLDRIEYRITQRGDLDSIFQAFEQGQLHDSPIPAAARNRVLQAPQYTVVRGPHLGISFLGLRTTVPPLDDVRVRQALSAALDRPRMAQEIYGGRYAPGGGLLPPGTYGYDPHYGGTPYDPAKAAALLAAAGYPHGDGLPILPLWLPRTDAEAVAEFEAIVQQFAAIGVRAEIRYNPDWADYQAKVAAGAYPVFRYSWYADDPSPEAFLGSLLESTSRGNLTQFRDPTVDALLQRARQAREWPQKLPLYQEIERRVVDQAPIIVLYYAMYERLFQRAVRGVEISPLGDAYMPMKKIWLQTASDH